MSYIKNLIDLEQQKGAEMRNRYRELTPTQQVRVASFINSLVSSTLRRKGNKEGWYKRFFYRMDNPETVIDWILCVITVLAAVAGFFGFLLGYGYVIETYIR